MSYFPIPPHRSALNVIVNPMKRTVLILLMTFLTACGGPLVGVTVVDERTALENQVLGHLSRTQSAGHAGRIRSLYRSEGEIETNPGTPAGEKRRGACSPTSVV